jgi:hypothetical protein
MSGRQGFTDGRAPFHRLGWWAHLASTRNNIELTIPKNQVEAT